MSAHTPRRSGCGCAPFGVVWRRLNGAPAEGVWMAKCLDGVGRVDREVEAAASVLSQRLRE